MKHLLAVMLLATPAAAQDPPTRALTLSEAVELARSTSPTRARLGALADASAAGVRAARAARLPTTEVSASYLRQSHVPELTLNLPGIGAQTVFPDLPNAWRTRAEVVAPLYTGGRIAGSVDAAAAQWRAAQADVGSADAELVLETVTAYWSLADAREAERVLAEALEAYDAHLVDARNRHDVGLAARNEVLAVQVERERGELARLRAANRAAVAEANLGRLTGLAGTRIEIADPPTTADSKAWDPTEDLVAAALAGRRELSALRSRVEAARALVRVQRAGTRPQASATAAYDLANPNTRVLPLRDEWKGTWSVGLGLSWTPWDGGRTSALAAQAQAQARALEQQLADAEQRVRLDVTSRALELTAARAALLVAERAVEAARENVKVSADRYREGVASSSDLLDAETVLLRAGLERTQAATELQLAVAALERAIGPRP
jgi:outer membrane protein